MDTILEINELSFGYSQKPLFSRLSFNLARGESLVIFGRSGSGKTSLLKIAAGILTPISGQINLRIPNTAKNYSSHTSRVLPRIGFLFQDAALIANMNISENICLPLLYHTSLSKNKILEKAQFYIRSFGLEDFVESLPAQISIGLKKRAALARALIIEPEILYLDDPLAETDHQFQKIIYRLTHEKKPDQPISILATTSNLDDIPILGERVLVIHQGHIVKQGTPSEIAETASYILGEGKEEIT